jgi:hypothetical protein
MINQMELNKMRIKKEDILLVEKERGHLEVRNQFHNHLYRVNRQRRDNKCQESRYRI